MCILKIHQNVFSCVTELLLSHRLHRASSVITTGLLFGVAFCNCLMLVYKLTAVIQLCSNCSRMLVERILLSIKQTTQWVPLWHSSAREMNLLEQSECQHHALLLRASPSFFCLTVFPSLFAGFLQRWSSFITQIVFTSLNIFLCSGCKVIRL